MRIGIDVGGTNTDAVLMDGAKVLAKAKTPTTADVISGIVTAVEHVLPGTDRALVGAVMIGTTHFTNAIVERRRLAPTGILRLGLPATQAIEPFEDWPVELEAAIGGHRALVHGGNEFDGREISPLDEDELRRAVADLVRLGVESLAIAAVFSPIDPEMEQRAAAIVAAEAPQLAVTLSHEIGRLGLLERENAAAINAALRPLAATTIGSFRRSLAELQLDVPLYLTQNDGTLMQAEVAERFPVLTFASGPTNSMRGAAFLSGLEDALVLDVGGTTSDVGALVRGFPRESSVEAAFADVRTNFRMPDLYSVGLGGGSIVREGGMLVGPDSVGYEISERALVFGGDVLTATDVAVAAGLAVVGDPAHVQDLDPALVASSLAKMRELVEGALDRMKLSREPEPVVLVGGGSVLVGDGLTGASRTIRPEHYEVANAVGAAIAQVSGEIDRIFPLGGTSREAILAEARQDALARAVANGAEAESVRIVDVDDVPVAYMEGSMIRVRVKAVGELVVGAQPVGS
jgi:N-methylhydantoinase A/oxoprolinase/acetone carboxylase beta subunit